MRKIHNLIQGTPEWHAYRANHFNASDAPAMLGISKYKSRDALLKEMATGIKPEIDSRTKFIFDQGHAFESAYRPIAIKTIGDDLYPSTISFEIDGLSLSASFDGITMDDSTVWEHKTLNAGIEDAIRLGDEIPEMYRAQMEMQMIVSGATRCLFSASRWTTEERRDEKGNIFLVAVDMIDHVDKWYESDPEMQARIIEGWKQFAIDLANYVAPEVAQRAVAEQVEYLPSVSIQAQGQISIIDNLAIFEQKLSVFLSDKLILKPKTDAEFETLKSQIKAMKDAEGKLKTAGDLIIAQIEAVDTAMRKKDSLYELVRQNRIMAEKLHAAETERVKSAMIQAAKDEIIGFKAEINSRFKGVRLPDTADNLLGVISGLKTHESRKSKLNDEVARCKIEIKRIASIMDQNLFKLNSLTDKRFLFNDLQQLITKDPEHFELIVKGRLQEHETAERERIQAEAKRIADEQIEADRKAKEAADQSVYAHGDNMTAGECREEEAKLETLGALRQLSDELERKLGAPASVSLGVRIQDDFQRGTINGLELAVKIYKRVGAEEFEKSVREFIAVGEEIAA